MSCKFSLSGKLWHWRNQAVDAARRTLRQKTNPLLLSFSLFLFSLSPSQFHPQLCGISLTRWGLWSERDRCYLIENRFNSSNSSAFPANEFVVDYFWPWTHLDIFSSVPALLIQIIVDFETFLLWMHHGRISTKAIFSWKN